MIITMDGVIKVKETMIITDDTTEIISSVVVPPALLLYDTYHQVISTVTVTRSNKNSYIHHKREILQDIWLVVHPKVQ